MSFYTGTGTELLHVSNHAPATINFGSSGSEAQVNTTALFGVQAHLPPDFWLPNPNQVGRGIRIVARGTSANTGTPTFTFKIRGGAAGNVASGPILLGTNGAILSGAATPMVWNLVGDIILTSIGAAGAHSTIMGRGTLFTNMLAGSATVDQFFIGLYGGAALPGTDATLDTSVVNYININVACSAVSASNTWTVSQLLIFGLN